MIYAIVAHDDKRGIATDTAIPWHLPKDEAYFKRKSSTGVMIMGYRTYQTFKKALPGRRNLVLVRPKTVLRPGFEAVEDLDQLLQEFKDGPDILWVIGGEKLFAQTLPVAQSLYITHIQGDFGCTKFFPPYEDGFELVHQEPTQKEAGLNYRFEVWHSNAA